MAEYKNLENIKKLLDEEYVRTKNLISKGETHLDNLAEGFVGADRVIFRLPTADVVEVKHGEWIKSIHKEVPIIKDGRLFEKEHEVFCCSVCDVKIVGLRNMSFCPFCGAKMDGERKCDNG